MEKNEEQLKQKVWETVQAMNRCWTAGDPAELANYFHKDMVALTPSDRERLEGRDACVAGWTGFRRIAKIHFWKEIDPKIQVYENSAVVTYYYEMSCDMGGKTLTLTGRDMLFLVKENGKWWTAADQFSPYPGQQG